MIRNLRWWIAGLLALATALNYLDRQSFPNVSGEVRKTIPMTDEDYARLGSLFLLAYGLMYAGGGKILDALGTRAGYALMIVGWSAANFATGFVSTLAGLGICRFLLGMGEGGGFPGSGKAVSEWFPPRERSFAFGIFNTGSALGAIVAAPLLAYIAHALHWRWVFFITGAAGFVWAAVWLFLYHPPARNRRLTPEERELIERSLPPPPSRTDPPIPWLSLFRHRQVWGLMIAKVLTDSIWFFLVFWLPRFLLEVWKFDIKGIGTVAWIPFAFAGAGSFLGGWLGSRLMRRGFTLDRARKTALLVAALLMPAAAAVAGAPLVPAVALFSVALFAHQFWSANVQTLAADLFPSRVVGSVEGLLGSAGALGAALFSEWAGGHIKVHGYAVPFALAGVCHLAAYLVIRTTVRTIEPVRV